MLKLQDIQVIISAINTMQIKGSDAPYVAELLTKLVKMQDKEIKKQETK